MPTIGTDAVQGYYYDAATDTLRPIAGTRGPQGPTGPPIGVLGNVANYAALPAANTVAANYGYVTNDTGHLWLSNGTTWIDAGQFSPIPTIQIVTALPGTLAQNTLYVVVT